MTDNSETIVAIATPPGIGGVGIVRLSGLGTRHIAESIGGPIPAPRVMAKRDFRDSRGPIDQGLVVFFPAPHSYTGQDVVEFHLHGSPLVLDLLVKRTLELGARMAQPGEFTQRAFLNDRISLLEAEAVADLISASSDAAVRAANRSLSGAFSKRVHALCAEIESLRIVVEASIDFAEEDLQLQIEAEVPARLREVKTALNDLRSLSANGRLLTEGATVVIAGRPNAGKSSLMNVLVGHDTAIVTPIPGTTRDLLRERISIDGIPITLIDTAGIRESADPIESEGIRRARDAINAAELTLYLVDSTDEAAIAAADNECHQIPGIVWRIYSKSDANEQCPYPKFSAKTGEGIPDLKSIMTFLLGYDGQSHIESRFLQEALKQIEGSYPDGNRPSRVKELLRSVRRHAETSAGASTHTDTAIPREDGLFSARRRHIEALALANAHVECAMSHAQQSNTDLFAEELRLAHDALGQIIGKTSSDDLLGKIFSTFCIGK